MNHSKENMDSSGSQRRETQPRLTVEDLKLAETLIIKTAQSEAFGQEIDKLTGMKTEGQTETLRYSLVGLETKSDLERCELSGKHHELLMCRKVKSGQI